MNEYHRRMMNRPDHTPPWCSWCGAQSVTFHHIVPRSQGGKDGPRITLCGHGTAGCHGKAEDKRLHLKWDDGWWGLETAQPTKYDTALELEGWRKL